MNKSVLVASLLCAPLLLDPAAALACGCFAPPDATTPLVQAGERIVFLQDSGVTTAHIQIQYAGRASDFGWLLPLPAVPKKRSGEPGLELGVDELFTQLERTTQPRYQIARVSRESCGEMATGAPVFGCGGFAASDAAPNAPGAGFSADMAAPSPLVATDSLGPYEFAILKADDKAAMLKWLADNRYFVPAGTDGAVAPYIRPGAYFLALKLRSSESSGSLQPVVVRYQSDLPMIPITLTSVGATPNMGIEVFLLGRGRGIPRNYYHVVLNDGQIDWFTAQNYQGVVTRAVAEAPERHAFVTEYAGTSALMRGVLLPPGRYSDPQLLTLEGTRDPVRFVALLPSIGFQQNGQLYAALALRIPMPKALVDQGLQPAAYYQNLAFYLEVDRKARPDRYADIEAALGAFDPQKAVADLRERIVTPTREADQMFVDQPYLTRLFTTLSPEDMNKDPAFSFNPSLPDVALSHQGSGLQRCDGSFVATTELGAVVKLPGLGQWQPQDKPYSRRVEVLRETGAPEIIKDNGAALGAMPEGAMPEPMGAASGCSAPRSGRPAPLSQAGGAGLLGGALGAALLLLRGRARRRAALRAPGAEARRLDARDPV